MRLGTTLLLATALLAAGCSSDTKTDGSSKTDKAKEKQSPPPPCHPGCFPAGTPIMTPTGPVAVDSLRAGDVVHLIAADGAATVGPIASTFHTTNVLVEVKTEVGVILTTPTQPLCLVAGGFRRAGELVSGDRVWRWADGTRTATTVTAVEPTGREAAVFNLVVGESAVFVAGGFLARGKPPLDD